jgi:hypothetical protein
MIDKTIVPAKADHSCRDAFVSARNRSPHISVVLICRALNKHLHKRVHLPFFLPIQIALHVANDVSASNWRDMICNIFGRAGLGLRRNGNNVSRGFAYRYCGTNNWASQL